MLIVTEFEPEFEAAFPDLCELFRRAPLTAHEGLERIVLHGYRGTEGKIPEGAELQMSLLVDSYQHPDAKDDEELLKDMLYATLAEWREKNKLDLTVIFDTRGCQLKCYGERMYNPGACKLGGFDCFGMYRVEDGKPGFILNSGFNVRYIYPCITIWRNPRSRR
jgi:hypothetical protein